MLRSHRSHLSRTYLAFFIALLAIGIGSYFWTLSTRSEIMQDMQHKFSEVQSQHESATGRATERIEQLEDQVASSIGKVQDDMHHVQATLKPIEKLSNVVAHVEKEGQRAEKEASRVADKIGEAVRDTLEDIATAASKIDVAYELENAADVIHKTAHTIVEAVKQIDTDKVAEHVKHISDNVENELKKASEKVNEKLKKTFKW